MKQIQIPEAKESENAALGAVYRNEDVLLDEMSILNPNDFFDPKNQKIFAAMKRLKCNVIPIDIISLTEELKKTKELHEVGGIAYLTYLANCTPSEKNVGQYVENIVNAAKRREILNIARLASSEAVDDSITPDKTLADIQTAITKSMLRTEDTIKDSRQLAAEFIIWFDDRAVQGTKAGIKTGLKELDTKLHGFQDTDLIILAARPAMGKTALALNWIASACEAGKAVYFVSCEMSAEQLMARLVSIVGGIPTGSVFYPTADMPEREMDMIIASTDRIGRWNMRIDCNAKKIDDLVMRAKRLKATKGLDMLVVDYLQLLHDDSFQGLGNRVGEIQSITNKLKALAMELKIPVIALSQLSRGVEKDKSNKRGELSDLRDSGAIEQDADVVMFLYRENYYNQEADNVTEINIKKHRNGETGTAKVRFLGMLSRFENL